MRREVSSVTKQLKETQMLFREATAVHKWRKRYATFQIFRCIDRSNVSEKHYYFATTLGDWWQLKRKDRLRELQQFYYGYVITKRNRHLGLVRRRAGRGGRIILDKFNEDLTDSISDCDLKGSGSARTMNKQKNNEQMMFQFDFTKL